MNKFEEYYIQAKEYEEDFARAEKIEDVEDMKEAQAAYNELMTLIDRSGDMAGVVYDKYHKARNVGNELIDFYDTIKDESVPAIVQVLRDNGIEKFTFSSGWSSAVETAWLFVQNGCKVEGMAEINSQHKVFMSDEYEKTVAYVFSIE